MELFFKLASPLTLASLIEDIDQSSDDIRTSVEALRELLVDELISIVGPEEFNAMMLAAEAAR